jgi:hypothetical protein
MNMTLLLVLYFYFYINYIECCIFSLFLLFSFSPLKNRKYIIIIKIKKLFKNEEKGRIWRKGRKEDIEAYEKQSSQSRIDRRIDLLVTL